MIKNYYSFIKESKDEEITIDANDYMETWECTLKKNYRNVKNGEVKRLEEIFEIPKYYFRDKFIGVYDNNNNFKTLTLNWDRYRPFSYNNDKLHFEEIIQKNGASFLDLYVGDKFDVRNVKPHGKGKYWKIRTKHIIIPKQRFVICKLYEYFYDLRIKFADRRIKIIDIGVYGRGNNERIIRMPNDIRFDINFNLDITNYNGGKLFFLRAHHYIDFIYHATIDILNKITSVKPIVYDPIIDPYGEEDWDIY